MPKKPKQNCRKNQNRIADVIKYVKTIFLTVVYTEIYDYYQPVVEDFELEAYLKDWCDDNGFKIVSCEGAGGDGGYEPDSVRKWIKRR